MSDAGSMITTPEAVQAAKRNHVAVETDPMLRRDAASAAMLDYWDKTDAIIDGIDGMRLAGERFLPRFTKESQPRYNYRLQCTKMTNVYRDIVEGLASKPFEEEITLVEDDGKEVPEAIVDFIEDVDGSGNNLTVFGGTTFFNGINSAIDWIFVDAPPVNPAIRSEADRKAAGIRPYWTHVLGRNVREARSKVINGRETLTYVRIYEPGKPDHIRVFERSDAGVVTWELFEKRDAVRTIGGQGETRFWPLENGTVTIGRIPLVPFITGRRDGRTFKLFPTMRDAVDLQISLYQDESGLQFVKRLAGYPMLAGNGIRPQMAADGVTPLELDVGPGVVLYGPSDASGAVGSWVYVEPSDRTMKFLAEDNKETIAQLREIGRQPLIVGNVTVITAGRAAAKSKSAVKAWAFGLKDAIENALVLTCAFLGIRTEEYDPVVNVYTEFDEFLEGKDLESLDADRDRGDISRQTLLEEKKRRGVYGPDFDPDAETQRILDELPTDDGGGDDLPPDEEPKI